MTSYHGVDGVRSGEPSGTRQEKLAKPRVVLLN
jgi:hypothetical protein